MPSTPAGRADGTVLADPERRLALAYAPRDRRDALALVWRLDEALGEAVARAGSPALAQMRLAWWHEALSGLGAAAQADPLLAALAKEPSADPARLLPMIDGWEALLDDLPLGEEALAAYAEGRGGTLFRLTAELLGSDAGAAEESGRQWALADLAFRLSDPATAGRALDMARRIAARRLPRPLAILSALARRDVLRGLDRPREQGSPGRVARAVWAGLTGR